MDKYVVAHPQCSLFWNDGWVLKQFAAILSLPEATELAATKGGLVVTLSNEQDSQPVPGSGMDLFDRQSLEHLERRYQQTDADPAVTHHP